MTIYHDDDGQLVPRRPCRALRRMSELRHLAIIDDDAVPVRAKRLRVPTANDDLPLSRAGFRSWKERTKSYRQWA